MRTIFPQKFTVVFFPQENITPNKVLDLAMALKSQFQCDNLRINNTFPYVENSPVPLPWIITNLPYGWKVTISNSRIDCILDRFALSNNQIPCDFYQIPENLFEKVIFPNYAVNRLGSVAQYQDTTEDSYKSIQQRFLSSVLDTHKWNSLTFAKTIERDNINFFDNIQIFRQEIPKGNDSVDSVVLVRDLNTGKLENTITCEKVRSMFKVSKEMFSIDNIEEEIYDRKSD